MTRRLLVCTDLDRTLLPNGLHPESDRARELFSRVTNRAEVVTSYVTGRHLQLVEEAILQYSLPYPDFAITDVGTRIYERTDGWRHLMEWEEEIAPDWVNIDHSELQSLFSDLQELTLQEPSKQNSFKLSYYVPLEVDCETVLTTMEQRLSNEAAHAVLLWSVDELARIGLIDVLPEHATKLHSIEFLRERTGFSIDEMIFAGDSGNDLPVLVSRLPAVLVANATDQVRESALKQARASGLEAMLHLAEGGLLNMNGNYAAGILEGLVHYYPDTSAWFGRT